MRRWARVVAAAVACQLVPPVPASENPDLEALRARIERLRVEIAGGEEARAEARDLLRESERSISESTRFLRELAQRRDAARHQLASLESQQQTVAAEIALRQDQLGRLLSARYLGGESSYLKLLVMGEDPNAVARELHYYGYVSGAQAKFIRSLGADLERLRALKLLAHEKGAEIGTIESEQRARRAQLLQQQAERRKVLERVSARLQSQRREVQSLERDEASLARLVLRLAQVLAAPPQPARRSERIPERPDAEPAFSRLQGRLRLPVRGGIANRFGAPRSEGGPPWKGLFIRAQSGQEVRAVASGRVVYADWMRGFGNLLILDHGAGYLSIYGNNESVLKTVGEQVRTGEAVATVGASGGSAESGLYFEIRHEGRAFDPLKWVAIR